MAEIQPFQVRDVASKPWGREILIAHTEYYTGKILYMNAGRGGPLQYHHYKDETFFLFSGEALVTYHTEAGERRTRPMNPGESIHVPPGAVHQVEALTDCVFFEASLPIFDDRVAVS